MQSSDPTYNVPPFPAFPSTTRYVPVGSVAEAFPRICRSIDAQETISLVVGPPGTGKSLMCALLAQHYRDSHDVVVLGETPIESGEALLKHLLHHLGVDVPSGDGDSQLALIDHVCGSESASGGLLIVVDEAQSLSTEVIESIRMVTNISRDGEPRVSTVLCGGVKFDETLVDSSMEAFVQRISTRCYLHPMNAEETRQYVTETIRNCGAEPSETISDEAIAAVHHACNGVPRLVNQMLTQAIDCAEAADQVQITESVIDQAWAELQQLPSPMIEEPRIVKDAAPIEFGELDDFTAIGTACDSIVEAAEVEPPVEEIEDEIAADQAATLSSDGSAITCSVNNEITPVETIPETDMHVEAGIEMLVEEESTTREEESKEQPTSTTEAQEPSMCPDDLFGHFDEEEDVVVGEAFKRDDRSGEATEKSDLEEILHQEIVGLSQIANSAQIEDPTAIVTIQGDSIEIAPGEATESSSEIVEMDAVEDNSCDIVIEASDTHVEIVNETPVDRELDIHPTERVEDSVSISDEQEPVTDDEAAAGEAQDGESENPVLWVPELVSEQPLNDVELIRDDSDMLVIEDEVELRRIDPAARRDAQDKTISVDFQAMLARMRSGSV